MVKVFPFKGILYNKKKLKKKLDRVMSPPYDVISEDQQDELYAASEFNLVRLIFGKSFAGDTQYNNKYVRAAAMFEGWLRHEALIQDLKPSIYVYEQRFTHLKKKYVRYGFIALLRLEDMGRGKIFPHEETLFRPKQDRLELLRATHCNFDCIFTLYADEKQKVLKTLKKVTHRKPIIEVKDPNKVIHRLYRIDSKPRINKIMKEMKDKAIFIADGHHRCEAAQRFKNEMKLRNTRFSEEESYNHTMVFFTPLEGSGLLVLPIHRLVKSVPLLEVRTFEEELRTYFEVEEFPLKKKTEKKLRRKMLRELAKRQEAHSFIMYLGKANKYYLLTLRDESIMDELLEESKPKSWKRLDVTILKTLILNKMLSLSPEDISYSKDISTENVFERVKSGEYEIAFILNPSKINEVVEIASSYEKMPQKSTFFYPKLISGLVMNHIVHGEKIE